MCCFICLTFRGAAYFGSSMQMMLGLGLFIRYMIVLLFEELDYNNVTTMSTTTILTAYGILVLSFGLFIFRGIEKESLTLLKVSVGGFTMLQILILITHFVLIVVAYEQLTKDEKWIQISMLLFNLIYSFVHLSVLYIYIVRLAKNLVLLTGCSTSDESEGSHSVNTNGRDVLPSIGSVGRKQCYTNEYNSLHSLHSLNILNNGNSITSAHSNVHQLNHNNTHGRSSARNSSSYSYNNPNSHSPQVFEGQWENLRDE